MQNTGCVRRAFKCAQYVVCSPHCILLSLLIVVCGMKPLNQFILQYFGPGLDCVQFSKANNSTPQEKDKEKLYIFKICHDIHKYKLRVN